MSDNRRPTAWQVTKSVLAGAIGVQSNKNREVDFKSTTIWPFVTGGIIFTAVFVIALIALVQFA